jgi:RNA polymerase sigma factor (sigma-70 family)
MATERQRLMSFAYRLLASHADAEDAVQETYARALVAFPDFPDSEPRWLYTVLRHIAIDRLRCRRFEAEYPIEAPATERSSESQSGLESDCKTALRHLLCRVSTAEAAAIVLRDVFEFDYVEIGCLTGKSEVASRQFLHRARTRIRRDGPPDEFEDSYVALFWGAIEGRDPYPLMRLLQTSTASARLPPIAVSRQCSARSSSMLVQFNGRYAIALVLDGIVLCIVPVGTQARSESELT